MPQTLDDAGNTDLPGAFREAARALLGDHDVVAISLSGGLDSAAVLSVAHDLCRGKSKRLLAVTSSETDDSGASNVPVVQRLVKRLAPGTPVLVSQESSTSRVWHAIGPDLGAMPERRIAINELAADNGATVLLTGDGADEVLGTPRYLARHLLFAPSAMRTYLGDLTGITRVGAVALESLAAVMSVAPRELSARVYWAVNNPEVASTEPPPVVSPVLRAAVRSWTISWLKSAISDVARFRDWAHRDAFNAICPYDTLNPGVPIREHSPFLFPSFVAAASRVPLRARYNQRQRSPYLRRKNLVVSLMPGSAWSDLPTAKQLFAGAITRVTEDDSGYDRLTALEIIDPDVPLKDVRTRMMLRALEAWIIGAETRGAVAVA